MTRSILVLLLAALPAVFFSSCGRGKEQPPLDASDLRGVPIAQLQEMREEIFERHKDGSELTDSETWRVEILREQERRLENAWVFGEWRERHGARLIFRDDGSVSVGARGGAYDELGVYKFISPEEPSFEMTWTVLYDDAGEPVVVVPRPDGSHFIYPFHRSRNEVYERVGDLQESTETGFYFKKIQ